MYLTTKLLAQVEDRGSLLNLVVVLVIGALIGLAKLAERAAQQRAREKAEELRRQREASSRERPETPSRSGQPQPQERRYQPMPTTAPLRRFDAPQEPAPTRLPTHGEPTAQQQYKRPQPIPVFPEMPGLTVEPPPAPVPVKTPRQVRRTVEQEIRRLKARLDHLDQLRKERLEARKPPKAKLRVIPRRAPSLATALSVTEMEPDADNLELGNLTHPDQARRAIVFHEIFSAPKALRLDRELWDL